MGLRTGRTPGNAASLSCARRRLAFIVINLILPRPTIDRQAGFMERLPR
jgi:hypothetical protein